VVFIHGLGASSRYWDAVAEATTGFRGIAPDLLGFGRSPKPPDASYDVACHLQALEPLVPVGAVLVAHSTGAILAAALAARRSALVSGLLLVGLPAFPNRTAALEELGRLGPLAKMAAHGGPMGHFVCQLMCWLRPVAAVMAPVLVRDLPRTVAVDGVQHTWPSYSRTLSHVVVDHRVLNDLAVAQVHTILLHSRSDHTAPLEYADAAARENDHVELRVVEGDHHVAIRHPEALAQPLAELMSKPRQCGESGTTPYSTRPP